MHSPPSSETETLKGEVAEARWNAAVLEGQTRVLEMMAAGAPLAKSLNALVRFIEQQVPGMLGSILLLDEQGRHLRHGAAPSLPAAYTRTIDGVTIGPRVGSCGTAAYLKEPVFVSDIATDLNWERYRHLALPHGLHACWSTPIFDPQGEVLGTFAMYYRQPRPPEALHLRLIEVATHTASLAIARHRSQVALQQSETKLKEAQRLARVGYWERDVRADRIVWSEETYRIFGLPRREYGLSQAELQEMIHPEDRALQKKALDETLHSHRPYDVEYRIILPGGDVRSVHIRDDVEYDDCGEVIRIFGTVQDVTERKRSEELLRTKDQEIRAIVENSPDLIVRYDRNLHRTYVNPAFLRATGLTESELLGGGIGAITKSNLIHPTPEEIVRLEGSLRWVRENRRPLDLDTTWPLASGRRHFVMHMLPELDSDGSLQGILAIARDVTELKETQRQLLALAENSPDIIARLDREARYLYVNRGVEKLVGIPARDLIGKRSGDELAARLGPDVSHAFLAYRRAIGQVFASGTPVDFSLSLPLPGGIRILNFRVIPERDEAGAMASVLAIGRDITEQQHALEALRESEQRFREVTENIDEVFWLRDVATNEIIYVSPAYEKVWGRTSESLYRAHRSWLDSVHSEDQERTEIACRLQLEGNYDLEYRIIRPDGAVRWIHDRSFPIRDHDGRVYRIAGVADDITAHRELEEQLRQAQKMEAIGHFAGGIAHDFNNIISVIMGHADLGAMTEGLPAEVQDDFQQIGLAAERAAALTRQLLLFSRRQVMQPRELDLNETVESVTQMLRRIIGEAVRLELRLHPAPLMTKADAGMLDQVLLNLAVNARDAMPNGGRLIIETTARTIESSAAPVHPHATPGQYVCLDVSDTGVGMPPEVRNRMFEPFFTTKEPGKGTGLGLATVFGIVQQHRGWIHVESQAGVGSRFQIFLPAAEQNRPEKSRKTAQAKPPGGTETILLVEDERSVRLITRALLEWHGYTVLEAANGPEALRIREQHSGPVHLLFTDMVMPEGITGTDLARRLREHEPQLRVIFTSGYSTEIAGRDLSLQPGEDFLQKPCPPGELLHTVRRCLDR